MSPHRSSFVRRFVEWEWGSPEILKLVENCPKGAETLVTRIIHILTEQSKRHFECIIL